MSDNDAFYGYYANQSLQRETLDRFLATQAAVTRAGHFFKLPPPPWRVADVGCGAATQCAIWARDGHQVFGIDINERLVSLGRERASAAGLRIELSVGSATALPWPDASMDLCLCPELLEHVAEWQAVVDEAVRIIRPGGVLYLSTTNKLCPVQEEFDLRGYSWYPAWLKRRYERLAVTSRPELVNHAQFPAVNWFTYFGLRKYLQHRGLRSLDRFDIAALDNRSTGMRWTLSAIRRLFPLRWAAHVLTPYTMVFAQKLPI